MQTAGYPAEQGNAMSSIDLNAAVTPVSAPIRSAREFGLTPALTGLVGAAA